MSAPPSSEHTTLLWGEPARRQAAEWLASAPLCAVATYPEYEARDGSQGRPQHPHPLQLLALSDGARRCVLDVGRTPGLHTIWPQDKAVAALDGQHLQHALWRAQAGQPARWASLSINAQILAAPVAIDASAAGLARDRGLGAPLPQADDLSGLCRRAEAYLQIAYAQAEALRGAQLSQVARLEAAAVTPVAALEHHGLPFDVALLRERMAQEEVWLAEPHAHEPKQIRQLTHLLATAGETLAAHVSEHGRLHAHFVQIGASSGRMATRNPNVQGLPKQGERRACVRAPRGHRLVIADYAACELRILAHLSGDGAYRDAFASGEDVHQSIAASLFGHARRTDVQTPERDAAKAISFGLVYGMQAKGLSTRLGCSAAEAQRHMDSFFRMYPKIREFLEDSAQRDLARGEVRTLCGRRIGLLPEDADRNARLARNLPIQGSGADILKVALRHLFDASGSISSMQLVHCVHDSLILLVAKEHADRGLQVLEDAMQQAACRLAGSVRWQVDAEVRQAWA